MIKIEEPKVGDRTRTEMAYGEDMDSFYFRVFNANKKSVCLNLKSQEGRGICERLARVSDVVVENFGPGTVDRLGLGVRAYERDQSEDSLRVHQGVRNPRSLRGFKSFDHIAQAMGGAMSTNGESEGPPLYISAGVGDSGTGLHCAIGILSALRRRDKVGVGDYVEVSMQDAVVNLTRIKIFHTLATGEPMPRAGNCGSIRPSLTMVYPCHPGGPDDYVAIYIGGDAWDSLLAVIGRDDLIGDERYSTGEARRDRADEVEAMITGWTSSRTKHAVMSVFNDVGIPCGAVLNTLEVLDDPHLRAREMVVDVHDPNRGDYLALGCPIKIASNTMTVAPPPLLGQHSDEVLSTVLGLQDKELDRLREEGRDLSPMHPASRGRYVRTDGAGGLSNGAGDARISLAVSAGSHFFQTATPFDVAVKGAG